MSKGSNLSSPVPMIKLEKFSNSEFSVRKHNTLFEGMEEDQWVSLKDLKRFICIEDENRTRHALETVSKQNSAANMVTYPKRKPKPGKTRPPTSAPAVADTNRKNKKFKDCVCQLCCYGWKRKASTEWWLDSGATCHVCNNFMLLEDVTAADETITVANGEIADVLKVGTATLLLSSGNEGNEGWEEGEINSMDEDVESPSLALKAQKYLLDIPDGFTLVNNKKKNSYKTKQKKNYLFYRG